MRANANVARFPGYAPVAFAVERKHYVNAARFARNVALFFAAPFVGLAYAVAFPLVGAGALAWLAVRAVTRRTVAA